MGAGALGAEALGAEAAPPKGVLHTKHAVEPGSLYESHFSHTRPSIKERALSSSAAPEGRAAPHA